MAAKVRAEGLESSGFQPWLTQVPPSGPFSTSATRVPILVAALRAVRPAETPQITSRSWRPWWNIASQILAPEQPQSAIRGPSWRTNSVGSFSLISRRRLAILQTPDAVIDIIDPLLSDAGPRELTLDDP